MPYQAHSFSMKDVLWVGSSKADWDGFPQSAQNEAGYHLDKVQRGLEPSDGKSMLMVVAGVCELRIRDGTGAFRRFTDNRQSGKCRFSAVKPRCTSLFGELPMCKLFRQIYERLANHTAQRSGHTHDRGNGRSTLPRPLPRLCARSAPGEPHGVAVVLPPDADNRLLCRELVYTGVPRAAPSRTVVHRCIAARGAGSSDPPSARLARAPAIPHCIGTDSASCDTNI